MNSLTEIVTKLKNKNQIWFGSKIKLQMPNLYSNKVFESSHVSQFVSIYHHKSYSYPPEPVRSFVTIPSAYFIMQINFFQIIVTFDLKDSLTGIFDSNDL